MSTNAATANKLTSNRPNHISFGLSLVLLVSLCAPALAQSSDSMDQESLLPPEVVPLDPAAASRMTQSQAQSRAANLSMPSPSSSSSQSVPGLAGGVPPLNQPEMQTAQEFRNQAYNSLYNQGTLAPPSNNNVAQQQQQWNGGQPGQMAQQPPNLSGQQPNMAQGASNGQMSQSGWMNANGAPQQQTLSGGVQAPNKSGNNTFNGAKRVLGTAAGFGGGMLVGALMMRNSYSSPAALMGVGLLGGSMMNYGLRNAFRGF